MHLTDSGVDPPPGDRVLSAHLDAEVATASAAQARMELVSVKIAAEGVLRQWPDAFSLQMDHSDQRYGGLVPAAVLDADGQELDDDMELRDDLESGAHVPDLIGNLSDDHGDWSVHRTFRNGQPLPGPQEGSGDDDQGDRVEHRRAGLQPLRLSSGGVGRPC